MANTKNLKTVFILCLASAIPAILPAATLFASVSPLEDKSPAYAAETLVYSDNDDVEECSERLCIDKNLGRSALKRALLNKRSVLLTFDDGPHPNTTPHILDILKKRHIQAVFFVLGIQASKYPKIIKRIHDEGHIIGNHSYSHKNLVKLKGDKLISEIEDASKIVEKITGERPKFFRPPFGAVNKNVKAAINKAGMSIVLWTVDTRDWESKDEDSILAEVNRQLSVGKSKCRGGAVLMHDIYPSTVRALDPVLDRLSSNNYKFVSINNFGDKKMDFWAVKAPSLFGRVQIARHANPEISRNPLMISLITDRGVNENKSHLAMLRAKKEGNLLVYLVNSHF